MIMCYRSHLIRAKRVIIVGVNNGDLTLVYRNTFNVWTGHNVVVKGGSCLF